MTAEEGEVQADVLEAARFPAGKCSSPIPNAWGFNLNHRVGWRCAR